MTSWYYLDKQTWRGPLSETEMLDLFEKGVLNVNTRVLRENEPSHYMRFHEAFKDYIASVSENEDVEKEMEPAPAKKPVSKGKIYRPKADEKDEEDDASKDEDENAETSSGKHTPSWLRPMLMAAFSILVAVVAFVTGMLVSDGGKTSPYQAFEVGNYKGSLIDGTQVVPSDFELRLISADGQQMELSDLQIHDWVRLKDPVTLKEGQPALVTFECTNPEGTFAFVAQALIDGDKILPKNSESEKETDASESPDNKDNVETPEDKDDVTPEPVASSADTGEYPVNESISDLEVPYVTLSPEQAYEYSVQVPADPPVRMVWITPDGCWQDEFPSDKASMSPEYVSYDTAIANNFRTPEERQALLDSIFANNPQLAPMN